VTFANGSLRSGLLPDGKIALNWVQQVARAK
jgi:hypothetical protein